MDKDRILIVPPWDGAEVGVEDVGAGAAEDGLDVDGGLVAGGEAEGVAEVGELLLAAGVEALPGGRGGRGEGVRPQELATGPLEGGHVAEGQGWGQGGVVR